MLDRDLLLAGALLHDIGKVQELTVAHGNIEYTDEGKLVGHLVMTAQKIREKTARIPGFPRALEQHLTHLVLAHHGHLEYGSPKLPMTLEGQVVHLIDLLDSRVHSWLELMAKDTGSNERWTENTKLYDRQLWKAAPPTSRGRSPIEGRKGGQPRREKKPRPEGGERKGAQGEPKAPKEKSAEKKGAGVPTFKPLAALASTPEPTEAAPVSEAGTAPEGNGGGSNQG
jgi:3'-5' exoribonuclease